MQKRVLILKRIVQCLRSDKAEADYISATIFIFVGVLFITFALNVFSIISAKLQLDQAADQLTKQIQLGTPFYVELTADATLGGFGDILPVQFGISSRSAGVSERYWKP